MMDSVGIGYFSQGAQGDIQKHIEFQMQIVIVKYHL